CWVYGEDALSFWCVSVACHMMRGVTGRPMREGHEAADDISLRASREGLKFLFESPLIRSTMLLDFFATFFSSASALLPIFAQDLLHVGAKGYWWLYAALAGGAVALGAGLVPLTPRSALHTQ